MNFKNGCPSDEDMVLKTKRILQLQRFRSVLVNHDLAFYRKFDDQGDVTVKDILTHHVSTNKWCFIFKVEEFSH